MTFLSRMAPRTTAPLPIFTPGSSTESDTSAPASTSTEALTTERDTVPPEMIVPGPTMEFSARPVSTNLAGGSGGVAVRMGQRLLYRLKIGCTDTRSRCAS
jgi:hypothetical protein